MGRLPDLPHGSIRARRPAHPERVDGGPTLSSEGLRSADPSVHALLPEVQDARREAMETGGSRRLRTLPMAIRFTVALLSLVRPPELASTRFVTCGDQPRPVSAEEFATAIYIWHATSTVTPLRDWGRGQGGAAPFGVASSPDQGIVAR